jgi:hypothetical protein
LKFKTNRRSIDESKRSQIEALNKDHEWVGELTKIIDCQTGDTECDLLILPQNLRAALSAVLNAPNSLNTDCVLVLGAIDDSSARAMSLAAALLTQTRASGLAFTFVPPTLNKERQPLRAIWFRELLRHVSHNQPIDVSLYRASRDKEVNTNQPLLFATRNLVDLSLVSRRLTQFVRDASLIKFLRQPEPDELYRLRSMDRWLVTTHHQMWDQETSHASEFARSKRAVESELTEGTPPPPKDRRIHTR